MNRIIYIIIGLSAILNPLFSRQPMVLNFETHALQAGANNGMTLCQYADPESGGENVVWDFSALRPTHNFTGRLLPNSRSKDTESFGSANTILDEFNNRFYLNITKHSIEQVGYSTLNNSVWVRYEKPFVKMIFPFTMGDSYSGDYYGSMKMGGSEYPVAGTYEVTADGYGKLILPGNITVDNALRVKTVKLYEMRVNNAKQTTETITTRWYGSYNRYPLLVLISIKTTIGTSVNQSYQAAYNNVIHSRLTQAGLHAPTASIRAYPNPATDMITLEYVTDERGEVVIDIYGSTGQKIKTLYKDNHDPGTYNLQLVPVEKGLSAGMYVIKANLNGSVFTEQIVIAK